MSAGTIFLKYGSTKIVKVKGVLTVLPVTGVLFVLGFLAITGTPPFGIFYSKLLILSAGMANHPAVTMVAMLLIVILFIGFLKQVSALVFGEQTADVKVGEIGRWLIIPPLGLLLVAVGLSFYMPPFLRTLLNAVVAQY